jgi:multiple sugar transport system substrate-binding protein
MRGSPARSALVAAGVLALAWPAQAETTLQLVEVITSPQRTEALWGKTAHRGVTVEITSLPWGQALEKLATMVR